MIEYSFSKKKGTGDAATTSDLSDFKTLVDSALKRRSGSSRGNKFSAASKKKPPISLVKSVWRASPQTKGEGTSYDYTSSKASA